MAKKAKKQPYNLDVLLGDMSVMYARRDARDKSRAHQEYLTNVRLTTKHVRAITSDGTLDDCFTAVSSILTYDLEYLARTEPQKKAILQHMKNFTDALHNLDAIRTRPGEYKRQAAGYIDDYKIGGTIPKDGMHGALRSYTGHLKSRDSQYLMPEEADFLEAQKELLSEITRRYTEIQKTLFT